MLKARLIDLGARIWARSKWAAKAIVGVAAPIVTDWLLEVLELVEGEARFWVALAAGGLAVFSTPNDAAAPDRAKLERRLRAQGRLVVDEARRANWRS